MFFNEWFILIAVTLWFSLLAFVWALQSGQFREQKRARFLPLSDEFTSPDVKPVDWKKEFYAMVIIAIAGVAGLAGVLFICILHQ